MINYYHNCNAAAIRRIGAVKDTDYKGGEDDNSPNDVDFNSSAADGINSFGNRKPVVVSLRHP